MIREQTLRARQKLVGKLPVSGKLLRGSLLERTVRHTKDCPKWSGIRRGSALLTIRWAPGDALAKQGFRATCLGSAQAA
jgi:hypothetical protein